MSAAFLNAAGNKISELDGRVASLESTKADAAFIESRVRTLEEKATSVEPRVRVLEEVKADAGTEARVTALETSLRTAQEENAALKGLIDSLVAIEKVRAATNL